MENNELEVQKEIKESKKRLVIQILVMLTAIIGSITIFIVAEHFENKIASFIVLMILGFVVLICGVTAIIMLEFCYGSYECRHCKHKFMPTVNQFIWGAHSITTRYLKCPKCGKKSFCKRKLTK